MSINANGYSVGDWVVRKSDYQKNNGDIDGCEWIFVTEICADQATGAETVFAERYDSETGLPASVAGRREDFIPTGVAQPDDLRERISEGLRQICPGLTPGEWDELNGIIENTVARR